MRTKSQHRPRGNGRGRRGTALIAVLFVTIAAASMGAVLLQMSISVSKRQVRSAESKRAFYIAEAGLNEAFWGVNLGRTGQVGTTVNRVAFGGGEFWVDAMPQDDGKLRLTSTALYGRARRAVELFVDPDAGLKQGYVDGLFSNQDILIQPNTLIDGYDSTIGSYDSQADMTLARPHTPGGGVIASNNAITIAGAKSKGVEVYGDVNAGPGQTLTVPDSATVTGDTSSMTDQVPLDPIVIPSFEATPSDYTLASTTPYVLPPGDHEYNDVVVSSGSTLVLTGPSTVVFDHFTLANRANLVIDNSAGPVEIYAHTQFLLGAGAYANTASTDPWAFTLWIGEDDPLDLVTEGASLNSDGLLFGVIQAPQNTVYVANDTVVYGAITADRLTFGSDATFHVDTSLSSGWSNGSNGGPADALLWKLTEVPENLAARGYVKLTSTRLPYQSHDDVWIKLTYDDRQGATQNYTGWLSAFDYKDVQAVSQLDVYEDSTESTPLNTKTGSKVMMLP